MQRTRRVAGRLANADPAQGNLDCFFHDDRMQARK
jgi:hypothetical protein